MKKFSFCLAAEFLINKIRHAETATIQKSINELIAKWNRLLADSDKRSHILGEARDILSFYGEADAIETWIREKGLLVSANDLGSDLDHCHDLQRKLTAPVGGKQVRLAGHLYDSCEGLVSFGFSRDCIVHLLKSRDFSNDECCLV